MKRRFVCVKRRAVFRKLLPQLLQDAVSSLAGQVHLVDKNDGRNLIAPEQLPERSGVALHAVCAAHKQQRIVQHLQRPLHFGRKVHMPRRIEKGNLRLRQRQLCLLGKDRNAARTFLLVRI